MTTADASAPTDPSDPRFGFAHVTSAVRSLIDGTTPDQLGNATPCPEFDVKQLLDHMNMVMARVAVLGNGGHWTEVMEDTVALDSGHAEAFAQHAHDVMGAWTDAAKLEQTYEVPWGELPGTPMMFTYTAELATHGWDLADATGQSIDIPDEVLAGAMVAIQQVPADGRDHPDVPFSAVVDPGPDAPLLLKLAGWAGRNVV